MVRRDTHSPGVWLSPAQVSVVVHCRTGAFTGQTAEANLYRLLVALCLAAPLPARGQTTPPSATPPPRVGVALSGGSAKGFAHIGVLDALERAGVPIDVVAGTSMGSIVGGLYAIGYSPAMLRRVAKTEDWTGAFRPAAARDELSPTRKRREGRYLLTVPIRRGAPDLPISLIGSQNVASILSRLIWAADTVRDLRTLPIPFVAVATDLANGEAVTLSAGPLSEVLRASMALPGIFAPVAVRGRRLIDGGVARNLPAQDARALGADVLICVDVSDPLEPADSLSSGFSILMQVITYRMQASVSAERSNCDVVIDPDLRGLSSVAFDQSLRWIERGEAAAEAAMPAILAALVERGVSLRTVESVRDSSPPHPPSSGNLAIRRVMIVGDSLAPPVTRLLDPVSAGGSPGSDADSLDAADAGRMAARLFATGRYASVASHPVSMPEGIDLQLDVVPENRDRIGLGLRFDTRFRAALLLGGQLYDRLGAGSALSLDARLGEQLLIEARYQKNAVDARRLVRSASTSFTRTPLNYYIDDRAVAEATVQVLRADAFVGVVLPTSTVSGIQLAVEAGRSSATIAPVEVSARSQGYYTISAVSWTDTFDRLAFPTRGLSVFAQAEAADRRIGSGATFDRLVLDAEARQPVHTSTTVFGHLTVGTTHGGDLPLYDRFFLGGIVPSAVLPGRSFALPAIDPGARSGRAIQVAELGVQRCVLAFNAFAVQQVVLGLLDHRGVEMVFACRLDERPRLAAELGYRF